MVLDASYSYGSFNTHKSYVNFGQTFKNGFTYEINAFQNYSDNDYYVNAPVENFETGSIDRSKKERVKRFNDTYHNEAVIGKLGIVDKKWADRLLLGLPIRICIRTYRPVCARKSFTGKNTAKDTL